IAVLAVTAAFSLTFCNQTGRAPVAPREALDPPQGVERAVLATAPDVPPPIARNYATRVILDVEIREHVRELADGVQYTYWTFGDETPGKFVRVREGDLVEVRLKNHPDNTLAHNIDFHAATGPGGGGEASFIAPGHGATFTWRAMRPGLFLYHCVAAPAGLHIANGMYGQILVEPKEGLPKVDKEFQVVQGEFYTTGSFGERGPQQFSMEKAIKEEPEYVLFNGQVGALMGDKALKAHAGERIRIYLANAGPSLTSSFHVVGEIFDDVYGEGGITANQHNVQTTVVPVGGSAMVEFTVDVPGEYTLVDHSMFRAFNKGAMGQLRVDGKNDLMVFSGRTSESLYNPGTTLAKMIDPKAGFVDPGRELTDDELLKLGNQVFGRVCTACHQSQAQGLPGTFPPLSGSDFLLADEKRAIDIVMNGLQGPIVVNGSTYNAQMPNPGLTDPEIAGVLSYVRNNFGNKSDNMTTVAEVKQFRAALNPTVKAPVVAVARPARRPVKGRPAKAPLTKPVAYSKRR
ncbi:MAG TPA: copper-containing nitrite reductase, partial [Polyangiaceae bacterium]|nr:copper-containing nitrite reductase [Polyangiaceae bacterium]